VTAVAVSERPSPFKAVGWAVLYLAAGLSLMIGLVLAWAFLVDDADLGRASPGTLLVQTASGLIAFGLVTWALGMRGLGLTLADLRWTPLDRAGRGFGLGFLLGAVPASLALVLSTLVGPSRWTPDQGDFAGYAVQVALTGLLLAPAALLEEIMFRGVAQVVLARAFGRLPAILGLSGTFALAHIFNPNGTPLALLNIALAGLLLGLAFYAPGGIWTAWGVHLGWNATLAALDAPVSGLPFAIPLIDYLPGAPAWLTGGDFGPEGGLLATFVIALASLAVWRWTAREAA
jgi:membrane protease YdiL (CAAX protease family)